MVSGSLQDTRACLEKNKKKNKKQPVNRSAPRLSGCTENMKGTKTDRKRERGRDIYIYMTHRYMKDIASHSTEETMYSACSMESLSLSRSVFILCEI